MKAEGVFLAADALGSSDRDRGEGCVAARFATIVVLLIATAVRTSEARTDPASAAGTADTIRAPGDSLDIEASVSRDSIDAPGPERSLSVPPSPSPSRSAELADEDARARQARPGRLGVRDSTRFRLEAGARTDVTNESYYEDAFVDTTFLGRQRISTPEERHSGVVSALWAGTRNEGATQYQLHGQVDGGDRLQRGYLGLSWRSALGLHWRLSLDPSSELRRDRTLGRDVDEWRGALAGRLRRSFADGFTAAELGLRTDLLRTSGEGTAFLLDRNSAASSLTLDHLGLIGDEWRLGYRLTGRVFPDSSERDHLEHLWEGRWKVVLERGPWIAFDAASTRRLTAREVPTSRDNFWVGEVAVEGRARVSGEWGLGVRAAGELTRYDVEDSTLFFDYQVLRGQLAVRYERDPGWSLSFGPRVEALFAELSPGEGYRELAATLEAEYLGSGSWWTASPVAGWRDYDEVESAGAGTPSLHSSYAFYELDLVADQAMIHPLRLRAITALRWEHHLDSAQDARSVYASIELRWAPR